MHFFTLPMYSEDHEKKHGYLNSLVELRDTIQKADGLVISVNEHNSNPSAYFKNLIDWLSRLDRKFLEGKKILLMSTSGGKRGAMGSLGVVEKLVPRFGGEVAATFSLPSFKENFDMSKGILDADLSKQHKKVLIDFQNQLTDVPIKQTHNKDA